MRMEFYEQRRQALIKKITIERRRVMVDEEQGVWNGETDYIINPEAFLAGPPRTAQSSKSGRSKRNRSMSENQDGLGSPQKGKSSMIEKEMM